MIGMETVPEVYFHWIMTYLHEAKVEIVSSHTVKRINGRSVEIANVYEPSQVRSIGAELIVMATARKSETEIYQILRQRGVSVEAIGCAVAPRSVYEATLEGHRAARALGASQWTRISRDMAQSHAPQYYRASS